MTNDSLIELLREFQKAMDMDDVILRGRQLRYLKEQIPHVINVGASGNADCHDSREGSIPSPRSITQPCEISEHNELVLAAKLLKWGGKNMHAVQGYEEVVGIIRPYLRTTEPVREMVVHRVIEENGQDYAVIHVDELSRVAAQAAQALKPVAVSLEKCVEAAWRSDWMAAEGKTHWTNIAKAVLDAAGVKYVD